MRTVNKVILIGNVTRDPSIKTTQNDKKVALFTVATNKYYKTPDGEQKSEAEFNNCVAWGPLAETCEKYLVKGKLVYVEGRLKTRSFEKEDGTMTYRTEVVISNLIFLNKRGDFNEGDNSEGSPVAGDDLDIDDKF